MDLPMYNEIGIDGGAKYQLGDWKKIAIHSDKEIRGFFGEYAWLSNFHVAPVLFEGLLYPSSENAYQAAKVKPEFRHHFLTISPGKSKREWKKHPLLDATSKDWDARKLEVMRELVRDKFTRNPELKAKLVATAPRYLEEKLWWKDTFWGVDIKLGGQNHLGLILMVLRDEFIKCA